MSRMLPSLAIGLLAATAWSGAALADGTATPPQVLGLVAMAKPLTMQCDKGQCTARLTSFCMQEERPRPLAGQVYDPVGDGKVTLVVERRDGGRQEYVADQLVRIESTGEFTSVRVSMPEAKLAALGARSVAVRVGPLVSLLPRVTPDKPQSTDSADYKIATGPKRLAAEAMFEKPSVLNEAAMAMIRAINALPSDNAATEAQRERLWQELQGSGAFDGLGAQGVARAKSSYDACNALKKQGYNMRVEGCLRNDHDKLLQELNKKYWHTDFGV